MRSTFQALPQHREGRVESAAVRYLLHRVFVEKHGWYVRGLDNAGGEAWNSSSPAAVFGQHVGKDAETIYQDRLKSHGLTLYEVAVLAATLESLAHEETIERLEAAYQLLGL